LLVRAVVAVVCLPQKALVVRALPVVATALVLGEAPALEQTPLQILVLAAAAALAVRLPGLVATVPLVLLFFPCQKARLWHFLVASHKPALLFRARRFLL
jgi:UPF0716 family protein affecting phage T7 exclusion